jgi:hypothetical protein
MRWWRQWTPSASTAPFGFLPFALYRFDASYALDVYAARSGRLGLVKPVDTADPGIADTVAAWAATAVLRRGPSAGAPTLRGGRSCDGGAGSERHQAGGVGTLPLCCRSSASPPDRLRPAGAGGVSGCTPSTMPGSRCWRPCSTIWRRLLPWPAWHEQENRLTIDSRKPSVVVDLRCLQDPNYAFRGVGRHALAMLRHAPSGWHIVGLTDPNLSALSPAVCDAVEVVRSNAYAASAAGTPLSAPACFIMMSPMTHDPIFPARLLSDPRLLRAAVVHDFIPYRHPDRYLSGPAERLDYANQTRWLARCDLFLSNSRSSAADLTRLLGVTEHSITVTGCPLDPPSSRRRPGRMVRRRDTCWWSAAATHARIPRS